MCNDNGVVPKGYKHVVGVDHYGVFGVTPIGQIFFKAVGSNYIIPRSVELSIHMQKLTPAQRSQLTTAAEKIQKQRQAQYS